MPSSWNPSLLPDLAGRTYVVTGGNTGFGYWIVHHLAKKHARVFLGCRNGSKGQDAVVEIKKTIPDAQIEVLLMDLMDLSSVVVAAKNVCQKTDTLHGLVNSAGIMATPFLMSKDGYESQFQTNYLAHWILTWHLLPLMQATAEADQENKGAVRIVNVSSMGHTSAPAEGINFEDTSLQSSFTFRRYGQSKLANILHSKTLDKRFGPRATPQETGGIWSFALHPGNANTQLTQNSWGSSLTPLLRCLGMYITPEEGSFTSLFAVAGDMVTGSDSGSYYVPVGKEKEPSKQAVNAELAEKLWTWTEMEMREKGLLLKA